MKKLVWRILLMIATILPFLVLPLLLPEEEEESLEEKLVKSSRLIR